MRTIDYIAIYGFGTAAGLMMVLFVAGLVSFLLDFRPPLTDDQKRAFGEHLPPHLRAE